MKTSGARDRYNRASALVAALLAEWRRVSGRDDPTLADAIASAPEAVGSIRAIAAAGVPPFPAELLTARLEHFLLEDGVFVPAAVAAFAEGRFDELGRISDDSQRAAEVLLGNQVPETIALARLAREHGALAASAFGAGFGGSVWALVSIPHVTPFMEAWQCSYAREHPRAASDAVFFGSRPARGALSF
jgi:galactokinase